MFYPFRRFISTATATGTNDYDYKYEHTQTIHISIEVVFDTQEAFTWSDLWLYFRIYGYLLASFKVGLQPLWLTSDPTGCHIVIKLPVPFFGELFIVYWFTDCFRIFSMYVWVYLLNCFSCIMFQFVQNEGCCKIWGWLSTWMSLSFTINPKPQSSCLKIPTNLKKGKCDLS